MSRLRPVSYSVRNELTTALGIKIPKATSREELRKALEGHPTVLPLLELELETMEEEWLLALQEELTKPYFLNVRVCPGRADFPAEEVRDG